MKYRSTKDRLHVPKHSRSCFTDSNRPSISTVLRQNLVSSSSLLRGYCNRGFYLIDPSHSAIRCFCPHDRRRVTVLVTFHRWYREDIPMIITVLIVLIHNNTRIVDHQFFSDVALEIPEKQHHYLFYPRPRLPGVYSVRFEAYHSLQLLALWEYSLGSLDFLPVFRLAKRLEFSKKIPPDQCKENLCRNNGTCYTMETNRFVCLCQREWHVQFCEIESRPSKCSPYSLVRDEQICICPQGYLLSNCFVLNRLCERLNLCRRNEICYSIFSQPSNRYHCFNNRVKRFLSSDLLTIHRNQPSPLPFLLQLLRVFVHYPRVRQQILITSSTKFPIQTLLKFSSSRDESKSFSDIGLISLYEPLKRTVNITLHLLDIHCSNSPTNITVDLNLPLHPCRFLEDKQLTSIKQVSTFCRRSSMAEFCFLCRNSLCFCNSSIFGPSSCLFYDQGPTSCSHCYNGGLCIRRDLRNSQDFQCICPQCASGDLCQYSLREFSLSLEYLIEKTRWGVIGIFCFLVYLFFSVCSLMVSVYSHFFLTSPIEQEQVFIFIFSLDLFFIRLQI